MAEPATETMTTGYQRPRSWDSGPETQVLMNDAHWTKRCVASCRVIPKDQEARHETGETLWALEAPSQVYQVTIFQYHRDELRSSLVGSNHVCNACILKDKFAKLPMST
jgi:hypothetical protein